MLSNVDKLVNFCCRSVSPQVHRLVDVRLFQKKGGKKRCRLRSEPLLELKEWNGLGRPAGPDKGLCGSERRVGFHGERLKGPRNRRQMPFPQVGGIVFPWGRGAPEQRGIALCPLFPPVWIRASRCQVPPAEFAGRAFSLRRPKPDHSTAGPRVTGPPPRSMIVGFTFMRDFFVFKTKKELNQWMI